MKNLNKLLQQKQEESQKLVNSYNQKQQELSQIQQRLIELKGQIELLNEQIEEENK